MSQFLLSYDNIIRVFCSRHHVPPPKFNFACFTAMYAALVNFSVSQAHELAARLEALRGSISPGREYFGRKKKAFRKRSSQRTFVFSVAKRKLRIVNIY